MRREWHDKRQPLIGGLNVSRLVFIDEAGTNTKMTCRCGRCLQGERLRATAPFDYSMTQTFIAGLRCRRFTAAFVVDRLMNLRAFETYAEIQLTPTLTKGGVTILDNLPNHKDSIAKAAVKARGA